MTVLVKRTVTIPSCRLDYIHATPTLALPASRFPELSSTTSAQKQEQKLRIAWHRSFLI